MSTCNCRRNMRWNPVPKECQVWKAPSQLVYSHLLVTFTLGPVTFCVPPALVHSTSLIESWVKISQEESNYFYRMSDNVIIKIGGGHLVRRGYNFLSPDLSQRDNLGKPRVCVWDFAFGNNIDLVGVCRGCTFTGFTGSNFNGESELVRGGQLTDTWVVLGRSLLGGFIWRTIKINQFSGALPMHTSTRISVNCTRSA